MITQLLFWEELAVAVATFLILLIHLWGLVLLEIQRLEEIRKKRGDGGRSRSWK